MAILGEAASSMAAPSTTPSTSPATAQVTHKFSGRMNVRFVTLAPNSLVYFKGVNNDTMERVTTIDRRHSEELYPVVVDTPLGLYVERTGCSPKLLLWQMIADIDFEGLPPDYANMTTSGGQAAVASASHSIPKR